MYVFVYVYVDEDVYAYVCVNAYGIHKGTLYACMYVFVCVCVSMYVYHIALHYITLDCYITLHPDITYHISDI